MLPTNLRFSSRFTGCVASSGPITVSRTISLQWMAIENANVPSEGFAKVQDIPFWTTGTKCVLVDTGAKVRGSSLCAIELGPSFCVLQISRLL